MVKKLKKTLDQSMMIQYVIYNQQLSWFHFLINQQKHQVMLNLPSSLESKYQQELNFETTSFLLLNNDYSTLSLSLIMLAYLKTQRTSHPNSHYFHYLDSFQNRLKSQLIFFISQLALSRYSHCFQMYFLHYLYYC